jgi:hypothetical protein
MEVFTSNADARTPRTADVRGCVDPAIAAPRTEDDRRRGRGRLRKAPRSGQLRVAAGLWHHTLPRGSEGEGARRSLRRERAGLRAAANGRSAGEGSTHEAGYACGSPRVRGSGNRAADDGCSRSPQGVLEGSRHGGTDRESETGGGHGRFARPGAKERQHRLKAERNGLQWRHSEQPGP